MVCWRVLVKIYIQLIFIHQMSDCTPAEPDNFRVCKNWIKIHLEPFLCIGIWGVATAQIGKLYAKLLGYIFDITIPGYLCGNAGRADYRKQIIRLLWNLETQARVVVLEISFQPTLVAVLVAHRIDVNSSHIIVVLHHEINQLVCCIEWYLVEIGHIFPKHLVGYGFCVKHD